MIRIPSDLRLIFIFFTFSNIKMIPKSSTVTTANTVTPTTEFEIMKNASKCWNAFECINTEFEWVHVIELQIEVSDWFSIKSQGKSHSIGILIFLFYFISFFVFNLSLSFPLEIFDMPQREANKIKINKCEKLLKRSFLNDCFELNKLAKFLTKPTNSNWISNMRNAKRMNWKMEKRKK